MHEAMLVQHVGADPTSVPERSAAAAPHRYARGPDERHMT